jgi:TonB-dependent receptor
MLDLAVASGLRLTGGVRLERVNQKVVPYDLFPLGLPPVDSAVLDDADWLPGINATWSPAETHNLRLAFSQTVARPEFREQAPFDFVDYAGGFLQVGNPSLKRTQIRNYDVRWEWFPGLGDLVAVSGFYKSFRHPIEAVVFPSSELIATWDNNDAATVYGAELEVRTDFGFLTEGLQSLTISSNLALIHSSVQTGDSLRLPNGAAVAVEPRTRPLQGQSPYTVNLSLSYVHPGAGFTITGLYNRFGPRIDKVGTQVLPDVFEEPRDQLDLVVEQPLGRRANAKVTASNLLDEPAVFTQAGQLVRRWSIGRTFTVGISIGS